jgi:hypothetical protein
MVTSPAKQARVRDDGWTGCVATVGATSCDPQRPSALHRGA